MSLELREPDSHFKGRWWRWRLATSARRVGVGRRDAVSRQFEPAVMGSTPQGRDTLASSAYARAPNADNC